MERVRFFVVPTKEELDLWENGYETLKEAKAAARKTAKSYACKIVQRVMVDEDIEFFAANRRKPKFEIGDHVEVEGGGKKQQNYMIIVNRYWEEFRDVWNYTVVWAFPCNGSTDGWREYELKRRKP